MTDGPASIPVEPADDIGSPALAAALAAQDVPAIGQALRHDYVVVPVTRGPEGETQVAVFGLGDGSYELCLFSSAATFAAYEAPTKEFALQRGSGLVPVIEEHGSLLRRVLFDPAGPHAMQASVEDVLAVLRPALTDDDVAWVSGPAVGEQRSRPPADRTVALDLALTEDWATIDLADAETIEKQAAGLVKRRLRGLPRSPMLHGQLTRWLVTSARTAAGAGGRFMAFFLRRTAQATVALNVTMYWHTLGPEIGGRSHLDAITDRIRGTLRQEDELVGAESAAGPFIRHTHVRQGAAEVGGQDTPVLVTDYWLQFPDRRGLCLLSFSSPHLDLRQSVQLLTDNIVLAASWVMEPSRTS